MYNSEEFNPFKDTFIVTNTSLDNTMNPTTCSSVKEEKELERSEFPGKMKGFHGSEKYTHNLAEVTLRMIPGLILMVINMYLISINIFPCT